MNEQATKLLHKCQWQVHAYCLMRNHFHFVIETPSANLVAGMSQMEARRRGKTQADHRQVRAVGAWGMINSERELLAVGKSAGGSHYGTERQERDQEKANRLVDEELRIAGSQQHFSLCGADLRSAGCGASGSAGSRILCAQADQRFSPSLLKMRIAGIATRCLRVDAQVSYRSIAFRS